MERSLGAADLRISHHPAHTVAGYIELRHHANTALARIGNNLAHLLLSIELAIRADSRELRIDLAFGAETLVVAQVPVEDIQLNHRHADQRRFVLFLCIE